MQRRSESTIHDDDEDDKPAHIYACRDVEELHPMRTSPARERLVGERWDRQFALESFANRHFDLFLQ
jgi:hypothetical protein